MNRSTKLRGLYFAVFCAVLLCVSAGKAVAATAVASSLANDTNLISQGYELFASFPSPNWTNGSASGQPNRRFAHSTVWTGQEVVIWGGNLNSAVFASGGGRYRPATDLWTPVSTIKAPTARAEHSAVWTGEEMIVWGGFNPSVHLNSGGRYDPTNQTWRSTISVGAPSGRSGHVAVWQGTRMIVWGGSNGDGYLDDGGVYDPDTDTWATLSANNPPAARRDSTAVWTGSRLLMWGGEGVIGDLNTGGQLLMDSQGQSQTWQPISTVNAPSARTGHTALWTGTRMLIWGGSRSGMPLSDGASYDPVADVWTPFNSSNAPVGRVRHAGVWTGGEMLIWGGEGAEGSLASGAAYNPGTDQWRPLSTTGDPLARSGHGAAWSGSELIVFGGRSNGTPAAGLQRLNPERPWYLYRVVQPSTAPILEIKVEAGAIELSWPLAASAGFVLERAANPGPTDAWASVATPATNQSDRRVVRLVPVTGVHFFRLRRQ